MIKRILTLSVIGLLALGLIGGTAIILARPDDAERTPQAEIEGRGRGNLAADQADRAWSGAQGAGRSAVQSVGPEAGTGRGRGSAPAGADGRSATGRESASVGGRAADQRYAEPVAWTTLTGSVLVVDSELTVETEDGEVMVGLGQSWYREQQGFTVRVGDEVRVAGFEEDGEFKAGEVENLTTGARITLRDPSGRPMWAGQGRIAPGG